ncbi:hypothetical protein QT397_19850 [Microbulbifer sp. MKSA007]|nr:hypothetical protein QT397_19850 [Microbulbifer sp. MKSA007]
MGIIDLYDFISGVAKNLLEQESRELIDLYDSVEELGPNEWSNRVVIFANEMLLKDIGIQKNY